MTMPLFGKKEKKTEACCIKCGAEIPQDASYCTVCGSSQNSTPSKPAEFKVADWREKTILRNGEYIVESFNIPDESESRLISYYRKHYVSIQPEDLLNSFADFGFALTNQRLIILKIVKNLQERTVVVSFDLQKEFPLESIQDIAIGVGKTIIYTTEGKYETEYWDTGLKYDGNYLRKRVIDLKGKKAAVSLDFSSLRSILEKGGIVLTTLSCPKCNGPIKMPSDGHETVCQHCGSTVYAQDIFKKLKTLLS